MSQDNTRPTPEEQYKRLQGVMKHTPEARVPYGLSDRVMRSVSRAAAEPAPGFLEPLWAVLRVFAPLAAMATVVLLIFSLWRGPTITPQLPGSSLNSASSTEQLLFSDADDLSDDKLLENMFDNDDEL